MGTDETGKLLHAYSKDFRHGNYVHIVLAVIAAAATFFGTTVGYGNVDLRAIGTFSLLLGILEYLFSHHAWKAIAALPFVRLENLSGIWNGQIKLGGNKQTFDAKITIKQTFNKISVKFVSGQKGGQSFSASMMHNRLNSGALELIYNYYAMDLVTGDSDFNHNGTAILKVRKNNKLKGKYFTQKAQLAYGYMDFEKEKTKVPKWVWVALGVTASLALAAAFFATEI